MTTTKNRAIVYVTDQGFLMPSLFSACQIAEQAAVIEIADIFIILVGVKASDELQAAFIDKSIHFLELNQQDFWRDENVFFNETHVPITSLGRLAMQNVVPDKYQHILYIDGDTYIKGNIMPLVSHTVASGKIAATNNASWLSRGQMGASWNNYERYCKNLGIPDATKYFNAGLLAFQLDTWKDMAPKALKFFEKNSTLCKHHDQSALNVVFETQREVLSPIWNYQTGYAELANHNEVSAVILHFTGAHKPWLSEKTFWGPSLFNEYSAFIEQYSLLSKMAPIVNQDDNLPQKPAFNRFELKDIVRKCRNVRKSVKLKRSLLHDNFAI